MPELAEKPRRPYVGQMGWYYAYGTPKGEFPPGVPRAAVVTDTSKWDPNGTISVAVLISLLEALTLAPMRCSRFLEVGKRDGIGRKVDFFFVQSGTATLVYGGEVPGAKETAPHELRGPAVKGGERKTLNPGDVVHIPAKVPHQLLVPAGKEFVYFVIKVDTP